MLCNFKIFVYMYNINYNIVMCAITCCGITGDTCFMKLDIELTINVAQYVCTIMTIRVYSFLPKQNKTVK